MKPVMQTKTAEGEGDCWNACVASLLEIEIDTIPEWEEKRGWFLDFEKWLAARFGMYPIWVNYPFSLRPYGYYILSGKSPRGEFDHAIIMYNGEFSHDPYPDGGDSLETALETMREVCIFVPHDPAVAKPRGARFGDHKPELAHIEQVPFVDGRGLEEKPKPKRKTKTKAKAKTKVKKK